MLLSQGTRHPLVSSGPLSLSCVFKPPTPLKKGIYTLTFQIQIKKRGQGAAERITVAYDSARVHNASSHGNKHEHNDGYFKFHTAGSDFVQDVKEAALKWESCGSWRSEGRVYNSREEPLLC